MGLNSPRSKKVCIIGSGPLGLSTAYYLAQTKKNNLQVTILEASSGGGGLASSHVLTNGQPLESYYHHIFCSDKHFIFLCKELGLDKRLFFKKASIGHFYDSKLYSLSGPLDILTSSLLDPLDRLRFILASVYLKSGIEKLFSGDTALLGSRRLYGLQCTQCIWQPLLEGKYSDYNGLVPMSWLAARIRDRSIKLGYLDGGFDVFYAELIERCRSRGVSIHYNNPVISLVSKKDSVLINDEPYDACLSTIGPVNELNANFSRSNDNVKYLGAICVIFELTQNPGIPYWTNYCDPESPVLAVISHRELDHSPRFDGLYPVYSAAYILPDSKLLHLSDAAIIELFFYPIQVIANHNNRSQHLEYNRATVYRTRYAQPVINPDIGLPPVLNTDGPLYQASMHSIYPNDRGQNYAIALGKRLANTMANDLSE